jgi:hypothetical protein
MPIVPEPAASQGYEIERTFYKLDGTKIDAQERHAERARRGRAERSPRRKRNTRKLLVVDRLPAGLEIDNPNLVDSGSIDAFSWLTKDVDPVHTEYRDDRFVAAFDRAGPVGLLQRRLCRARRRAGRLRLSAGDGRRHVSPRPLRPHRLRHDRGDRRSEPERPSGHLLASASRRERAGVREALMTPFALGVGVLVFVAVAGGMVECSYLQSLGPLDLRPSRQGSTIVVDRDGRLLRAFTLPDGRWRLPVAAGRGRSALSRDAVRL